MAIKEIDVTQLYNLIEEGGKLNILDVRSPEEFEHEHAQNAKLFTLEHISPEAISKLNIDKDQPIYFICRSGRRSYVAAEMFVSEGYNLLYNIEGGTMDWVSKGYPVCTGIKEQENLLD